VAQPNRTLFAQAAIASGLLSAEHLERATSALASELAASDGPVDGSGPRAPEGFTDKQLSEKLIELGFLNRWQVGQLLQGYTKFTLGSYQVLDAIGKGGMGYVFKGMHVLLGRVEAIKVLPRDQCSPQSIAAFCREIRALAHLDHPKLVRLTYADKDGDTYFLVTEYVSGSNLRRLVRNHGTLSAESAALIFTQAAEGLQHAHEQGLVHRDVKPGNLIVTPEGQTKLTDLGLAAFSSDSLSANGAEIGSSDAPKHIVGTPDYVAPEVVIAPSEVRSVSDIYSLGCTLYYAVTGKVPFPGGIASSKLRRHLEEMPLSPKRLNPDLDDRLVQLIADMMCRRPEDRISTASEVIERLRPWTESARPDMFQQLGDLAQAPGIDPQQNSVLADTTPVATDQLETRHATKKLASCQTAVVDEPPDVASSPETEDENAGSEKKGPNTLSVLGGPVIVMVLTAVVVALTATILVLLSG
jgi:eukaryotic-like serine/threonine-protein kinase